METSAREKFVSRRRAAATRPVQLRSSICRRPAVQHRFTLVPVLVHWSADNWLTTQDTRSADTQLGVHVTNLPTQELRIGTHIAFTLYWPDGNRREQRNYSVVVASPE